MLRLRHIKYVDHAQIGHLYEHLFCVALVRHFRENGLYAYLDYRLDARAYYTGIVEVTLELYTSQAIAHRAILHELAPDFNNDEVNRALLQMLAEKHADVRNLDKRFVLARLVDYQSMPWQSFDELPVRNAAKHSRVRQGLELERRNSRHFLNLRQDMILDNAYANRNKLVVWPLFYVLSSFILQNLGEDISDALCCYAYDNHRVTQYTSRSVKETVFYCVDKRQATTLTGELAVTIEFIQGALANGATGRLVNFLQTSSVGVPNSSPDIEELYQKTALLVGAKGWKEIGSEENILETMKHTTISYTLGREKASLKLADVL